jgi:hypothetical protein
VHESVFFASPSTHLNLPHPYFMAEKPMVQSLITMLSLITFTFTGYCSRFCTLVQKHFLFLPCGRMIFPFLTGGRLGCMICFGDLEASPWFNTVLLSLCPEIWNIPCKNCSKVRRDGPSLYPSYSGGSRFEAIPGKKFARLHVKQ